MESQFTSDVRKSAEEGLASGLFCAESVVLALAKAQGVESDLLPKIATAFCSGMARTCGTCGALTGAIMGVSLAFGRSGSSASVEPCYAATRRLIHEFEQEFGARDCNVLLGCDLATPEGQAMFREQRLGRRCAKYTGRAAELAARIISSGNTPDIEPIADMEEARRFLSTCGLPASDIGASPAQRFFGHRRVSDLIGVVGLETFGSVALLRSLAVAPAHRKRGLGKALVGFAEAHAATLGVKSLFLLTTTAEAFFAALGYAAASRADAPRPIKATAQFADLCPASSCFMSKSLVRP